MDLITFYEFYGAFEARFELSGLSSGATRLEQLICGIVPPSCTYPNAWSLECKA